MSTWNVVVTLQGGQYNKALEILSGLGDVQRTEYYNVITMKVEDPARFPPELMETMDSLPRTRDYVSRAVPVFHVFSFQDSEEFQDRAQQAVAAYAEELPGRSFHVRMHRRGFKGRLKTPEQERFLTGRLLTMIPENSVPPVVRFDDPDLVVAVETVGNAGGVSFWTREDMKKYPFLRFD